MSNSSIIWKEASHSGIVWNDATWYESSLYAVLEVAADASPETIRRAYLRLAARCHPDGASESVQAAANEQMVRLNQAYELLRDPERRSRYDKALKIK